MTHEDHPDNNQNKTFYRNQINKVANAINEIIGRLRSTDHSNNVVSEKIVEVKTSVSKNLRTKIILASVIGLVMVALGYFIITKLSKSSISVEKSIAVLPFINDSPNDSTTYFINGLMEEILTNLQKVNAFSKVLSRTSTEQYRGKSKLSIPKISKELDVNYIVEGSGQKYGNSYRIRVELIEGKTDKHLWADSYEREIRETRDIYGIQSQIAQSIAAELNATITPEEKLLINYIPTTNLTANDFYQRGTEELWKYYWGENFQSLNRASEFFLNALYYDSAFAKAYAGLAGVYYGKNRNKYGSYFSKNYLDSVLILADRALSFEDHLAEGHFYRAIYYINTGSTDQAIKEYNKAIECNPNYWQAYEWKAGDIYLKNMSTLDYVKGIEYLSKAASINRGKELPGLFGDLSWAYGFLACFPDEARRCIQEAFKLDGDSTTYLSSISDLEIEYGDFEHGIEKSLRAYAKDSDAFRLAWHYSSQGMYKESLKFCRKYVERSKSLGQIPQGFTLLGFVYWQNGYKEEGEHFFNEQKNLTQESMKLGRDYSMNVSSYYDMAGVCAFSGERAKAYELLRKLDSYSVFPYNIVENLRIRDPLFNNIRNEPEFQKILKDMESKYQVEHERVRKWLEEKGML